MTPPASGAVVIGASAGGVQALLSLLPPLSASFPLPILIVLHIPADRTNVLTPLYGDKCRLEVKEADDKETMTPGMVYFAPADYHLLVETNGDLALSSEEAVNYSRPAIDVLFESAADAYGPDLIGIVLTGANDDGARGLRRIYEAGGTALIEDPSTAYAQAMPEAALKLCPEAQVRPLDGIVDFLKGLDPE